MCYLDPLAIRSPNLCLIYLILSIGLVLANPATDTPEYAVIASLGDEPIHRAEMFYRSAKMLEDPVSGFEDADIWSVQALCLMTVYQLAVSRRNAAYSLHGEPPCPTNPSNLLIFN